MNVRTIDDDYKFKIKQRYATISDWTSKTIDSERVQGTRAKSQYGAAIKIKPTQNKLRSSIPKRFQHLILNQGLSNNSMKQQPTPTRKNRFSDQFNNIVFNYKPRITNSIQPTQQSFSNNNCTKVIDSQYLTKSLDYANLQHSYTKTQKPKRTNQSNRFKKQLSGIYNKMKLTLDSYKNREKILLQYIMKLQQEIIQLKQSQYKTLDRQSLEINRAQNSFKT